MNSLLIKIKEAAKKAIDVTIPPKIDGPNDKCFCGHKRKDHPVPDYSGWRRDNIHCYKYWFNPHGNAHELQAMWNLLTPEVVIKLIDKIKL